MRLIETALFITLVAARVIQIGLLILIPALYLLGLDGPSWYSTFFTVVFTGAVSEGLLPHVTRRVHKRNPALAVLRTIQRG